jgi:hypothetical protein
MLRVRRRVPQLAWNVLDGQHGRPHSLTNHPSEERHVCRLNVKRTCSHPLRSRGQLRCCCGRLQATALASFASSFRFLLALSPYSVTHSLSFVAHTHTLPSHTLSFVVTVSHPPTRSPTDSYCSHTNKLTRSHRSLTHSLVHPSTPPTPPNALTHSLVHPSTPPTPPTDRPTHPPLVRSLTTDRTGARRSQSRRHHNACPHTHNRPRDDPAHHRYL